MTDRRRHRDTSLVLGMAAGILATLCMVAGLDLAASKGFSIEASLLSPAGSRGGGHPAIPGSVAIPGNVSRVVVDGHPGAIADGLLALPPGLHRMEFYNDQNDVWVTGVTVEAGSRVDVVPVWTGELIVDAGDAPRGATLRMDGADCESFPAVLDEVDSGSHVLSLHDGGELVWETRIALRAGQVKRIVPQLHEAAEVVAYSLIGPSAAAEQLSTHAEPQPY